MSTNKKSILIIGAGFGQVPAIKKAKEIGLRTIVIDKNPKAEGMKLADVSYAVDVIDEKKAIKIARKHKISGVMTMQTDLPVPTVGTVADALKLPGISKKNAKKCSNKIKTRLALKSKGVPQPKFIVVRHIKGAVDAAEKIGFPCIIKTPDSSGSRGVVKVNDKKQIRKAFKEALRYTKKSEILVEEYVKGLEIGAQGFCFKNKCVKVFIHNDVLSKPPFMIPIGHSFPFKINGNLKNKIKKVCANAIEALGINEGPSNIDIILKNNKEPIIIEIGARIGATCLPELIQYHSGIDWVRETILCAVGEKINLKEKYRKPVAALIIESPKDGIFEKFDVPKNIFNDKNILEFEITAKKGDKVNIFKKGSDRIGRVIVMEKTVEKAEKLASYLKSKIKFRVK